ncbi:MAG: hypothetical protein IJ251_03405 [Oscillospiraceae bacterium]|nr:hypothetical protein [Oscillospiraceae bacterium]
MKNKTLMNKISVLLLFMGAVLGMIAVMGSVRLFMSVDMDAVVTDVSKVKKKDTWAVTVTFDIDGTEYESSFTTRKVEQYPFGSTVTVKVDPMTRMVITPSEPITAAVFAAFFIGASQLLKDRRYENNSGN